MGLRPQPKSTHDTECGKTLAHRSICEYISPPTLMYIYIAQTHVCTYTTIHLHTYIHNDIFTHIHRHIYTFTHMHIYTYTHVPHLHLHTYTLIYTHICSCCLVCDSWSQTHYTAKEDDLELLITPTSQMLRLQVYLYPA